MKEVLRHHVDIVDEFPGSDLVGRSYEPLFPEAVPRGDSTTAWTVLAADWVTTTDGTGVVHTAVMYGEDDYNLGMEAGLPAHHTVGMDGAFVDGTHPELDGKYVKSCDEAIIGLLSAPKGSNGKGRKAGCSIARRTTFTTTRTAGEPTTPCSTTPWTRGLCA